MEQPEPQADEWDGQALVAFLPRLYAPGFQPVTRWLGGDRRPDGSYTVPYPAYEPLVEEFIGAIRAGNWIDKRYSPEDAARIFATPGAVEGATLPEIRTLLTFIVRGERFSDGHWEAMIEGGNVRRGLERLAQLYSSRRTSDSG